MRYLFLPLVLALCGPPAWATDPAPANPIRLPAVRPTDPQPMPGPQTPTKLDAARLFIIDSDIPVIVLASPPGVVAVTEETGPIRVRAKFADGPDAIETRTYAGKYVVTVEAAHKGTCELLIVPVGAKSAAEVIRRTIEVTDGTGPTPPPKPPVDPITTPSKLVIVVVEETAEAVATRGAMLADPKLLARMEAKGHKFRVIDKDVVGPDGKPPADVARFLTQSGGKPLPQLFLVDEKGKARFAGDAPKTAAQLLDLITTAGG